MAEIGSNVGFISGIVQWIAEAIIWLIGLFTGGITSIASISLILVVLLLATIWVYQNQEKLAEYF